MMHTWRVSGPAAMCAWLILAALFSATRGAIAQTADPASPPTTDQPAGVDIAGALDDLASKKFGKRQAAFETLVSAGTAAVDALEKSAEKTPADHLEMGARCVEALAQIAREKKSGAAALAALQRLAENASDRIAQLATTELKQLQTSDQQRAIAALVAAGAKIHRDSKGKITSVSVYRDREIPLLHHLPSVRSVRLTGAGITNTGIKSLVGVKGISFLTLFRTSVTDFGLRQIRELRSLDHLSLSGNLFTTEGLRQLRHVASLRTLMLYSITDDSHLQFLADVPQIRSLYLSEWRLSEASAEIINRLDNLKTLSITVGDVDDRQLHWIAQIRLPLRLNVMHSSRVTVAGWKELADAKLSGLTLMRTSIDDAGLAPLGSIVTLESLTIYNAPVTDEGLAQLMQLKSLRFLRLRDTKVTDDGVARLRKALPNLRHTTVDSTSANARRPPIPMPAIGKKTTRSQHQPDGWVIAPLEAFSLVSRNSSAMTSSSGRSSTATSSIGLSRKTSARILGTSLRATRKRTLGQVSSRTSPRAESEG